MNLHNVDVQSTRRKKEGKKGGRKSERDVLLDCIRKKKRETLERDRERKRGIYISKAQAEEKNFSDAEWRREVESLLVENLKGRAHASARREELNEEEETFEYTRVVGTLLPKKFDIFDPASSLVAYLFIAAAAAPGRAPSKMP